MNSNAAYWLTQFRWVKLLPLIAAVALLSLTRSAQADIVQQTAPVEPAVVGLTSTINATQDTWISADETGDNHGACDKLRMDKSGLGLGDGRMLVQFDLAGIPAGATITSAELRMVRIGGDAASYSVNVRPLGAAWDEGAGDCDGATHAANWLQRKSSANWAMPGGDYDHTFSASSAVAGSNIFGWYLTPLVQDWVDGTRTNYGVILGSPDSESGFYEFAGREHADPGLRPQLIIEHTGGAISGVLWQDSDGDGQRDGGEPPLPDVDVQLFTGGCGLTSGPPDLLVSSDDEGDFQFIALDANSYCVIVDPNSVPTDLINTTAGNAINVMVSDGVESSGHEFGFAPLISDQRSTVGLVTCDDITWLEAKAASYGGSVIDGSDQTCTYTIETPPGQQQALQTDLADEPDVAHVGSDIRMRHAAIPTFLPALPTDFTPNDPYYNDSFYVYAPQQIGAERAWDHTTGDPSVIIAISDSGVDVGHEEFTGRTLPGYDYVNSDPDPSDDRGHGTHVAGTAAAGINNGIGIAGIAGTSTILPLKVLAANGGGWLSDVALSIIDAVDQGAKVVNLSLGGPQGSQTLLDAIQYAAARNVLIVAAAGNTGVDDPHYPAAYTAPNVLGVGATTPNGDRWTLSNHGPNVEIMAPGQLIYGPYWQSGQSNSYGFMTGTSMATPHVAGAAALLYSLDPGLTPTEVTQYLIDSAIDLGDPGFDTLHGHGRIDLGASVQALVADIAARQPVEVKQLYLTAPGQGLDRNDPAAGGAAATVSVPANSMGNCNLLKNGGLELGLEGWEDATGGLALTSDAYQGANALLFGANAGSVRQSFSNASAGETYTFRAMLKPTGAFTTTVGIDFFDSNWNEIGSVHQPVLFAPVYVAGVVTATAPAGTANLVVDISKGAGGPLYVDNLNLVSAGIATTPPCQQPPAQGELCNLISNHGVELGLEGWDNGGTLVLSDQADSGANALRIGGSASGTSQSIHGAIPGETYALSARLKSSADATSMTVGMRFHDADWNDLGEVSTPFNATTNYTDVSIEGTAPAGTSVVNFWFWADNGYLYIDNVSLNSGVSAAAAICRSALADVTTSFVQSLPLASPLELPKSEAITTLLYITPGIDGIAGVVRDEFSTQDYARNDGSVHWSGPWTEVLDPGTVKETNGLIQVRDPEADLHFQIFSTVDMPGRAISREADLSGATTAIFSYDYVVDKVNAAAFALESQVSHNGGVSWVTAATYSDDASGHVSFNISPFISTNTQIRFIATAVQESTSAHVWLDNVEIAYSGPFPASPAITATLLHSGTVFANLTNPAYDSGPQTLTWSGVTGNDVIIPAGEQIELRISSDNPGLNYTILYDSPSAPSRVDLTTSTFIDVTSLAVYAQAHPTGSPLATLPANQSGYIRITVSDPFGPDDITGLDLTIDPPAACGSPQAVFNLDQSHVVATTAATKTYEVAWNPGACVGEHTFTAVAHEGTEGVTNQWQMGFTVAPVGSIGDTVWADADADGIRDPYEARLDGVTVQLTDATATTITAITDANGEYDFTDVAAGAYTVTLDVASVPPQFNLLTTPYPRIVHLKPGEDYNAADIGVKGLATAVGDFIWYDADADGFQDVGEPGIGNVTLELYIDDDDSGAFDPVFDFLVDATVSGANGAYLLHAPADADYFVVVSDDHGQLSGLVHTIGAQSMSTPLPAISLATGVVHRDADYGYVRVPGAGNGVIMGQLWLDGDSSGLLCTDEPVLLGSQVCATPTSGGAPLCANTDLNGRYSIVAPAGSYEIAPASPPPGLTATTAATQTHALGDSEQLTHIDFGYTATPPELSTLGGEIWQDIPVDSGAGPDTDGIYDHANEPGIGNVSVNLVQDLNDNGDWDHGEPILATLSDADGIYSFNTLLPGNYVVEVSDTLLVLRTYAPTKPGPDPDADDNNHPQPYATLLNPGEIDRTVDFGYRQYEVFGAGPAPDPGVIGNQVWLDVSADGIFDPASGDQPIPGVTVELLQNGAVIRTATTGGDGGYLFTDLPFGNYTVRVSDAFGVLSGHDQTQPGSNPTGDNHNKAQPYALTLSFLQTTNSTADFGYLPLPLAVQAGDCNGDAIVNAGDISALVLEIFDGDGNTTSAAGGGTFAGAGPGCDANGDAVIDAGDISCAVLLIFNGPGACDAPISATQSASPALTMPTQLARGVGGAVEVPVSFGGGGISSLVFSIDFDQTQLGFAPRDNDGDGLPDAIVFDLPSGFTPSVRFDSSDDDGELDITIIAAVPGASLPAGIPVRLRFESGSTASGSDVAVKFAAEPPPSFGAQNGLARAGVTNNGARFTVANPDVTEQGAATVQMIYIPVVSR